MAPTYTRENRPIRRLSSPLDRLKNHYDAIVVGSGYGAAVAASRLARARKPGGGRLSVCVLERGDELQPGEYPSTPLAALGAMQVDTPEKRWGLATALYDFRVNDELNAFVGCGLGGGSLVNANVSLEPEPRVLLEKEWPGELKRDVQGRLKQGFERAREMLKPVPYPANRPTPAKLDALGRMGGAAERPPINVHFGEAGPNHVGVVQLPCTDCGDCVSGCNISAKNTLLMNYLPDAVNHGAEIFTRINVRSVERDQAGKRWIVRFTVLGADAERFDAAESFVFADRVFLGAGSLGSTEILLRSRHRGLAVSDKLGHSFTGNGDVLAFAYNSDLSIHPVGFGVASNDDRVVGPCITGIRDLRASAATVGEAMVIEEGSLPSPLAAMLPGFFPAAAKVSSVPAHVQPTERQVARELDGMLRGAYYGAVDHTQVMLVMAHDDAGGTLSLADDRLRISWPGLAAQPVFANVVDQLRKASQAIGGVLVKNPAWADFLGNRLITVHPLGGCGMGDSASHGVVDDAGRVFAGAAGTDVHPGLYVCDGAVMPRALGVNPLLTITAVAERTMALVAEAEGWSVDYTLPSAPAGPVTYGAGPVGIQFTETMRGYVSAGDLDYERAAERGAQAGLGETKFTLTITIPDLERLIGDPAHRGAIVGTVHAPPVAAGPLAVSEGVFQLLPLDVNAHGTRAMRYSMKLTASDGQQFQFTGLKTVHDDPGPDVWDDTTTLAVDIGKVGGGAYKGVLKIFPTDLAIQLTTLKALGAKDIASVLEAKARFMQFFAGAVVDTYGGVSRTAPNVWPPAKGASTTVRERRALRLPVPEVHTVTTLDGVSLRLTRYRGGSKGPVLLGHGLGVSSRIFTANTIDTNLAEYLVASGFDTWLLDFRASIDLPASTRQFSGDEVAKYDYPAAVDEVRRLTAKADVQVVGHCFGSSTLAMAIAAGLKNVRSAVFSQVAGHIESPGMNRFRAAVYMPDLLKFVGLDALTTDMSERPDLLEKVYDRALRWNPAVRFSQRCKSTSCHRISFMYAPLYQHEQLNEATHAALGELFGIANVRSLQHLARMIREKKVVSVDGADVYFPDDALRLKQAAAHFRFPVLFIHGAENECFLPRSTERTLEVLRAANPTVPYERVVIPKYGHIDCIFGKDAARDVYPKILTHLERTA